MIASFRIATKARKKRERKKGSHIKALCSFSRWRTHSHTHTRIHILKMGKRYLEQNEKDDDDEEKCFKMSKRKTIHRILGNKKEKERQKTIEKR